MGKDKKYKGGPARKSYLQNMAKQGGGTYSKFGDYDPKDVHDKDITYSHRGEDRTVTRGSKSVSQWVSELVSREGKGIGDAFRHGGSLYKIAAGHRPGTYVADRVSV